MLYKSQNAFEYFVNNRHILFNSHSLKTFCVDKDYIDVLGLVLKIKVAQSDVIM